MNENMLMHQIQAAMAKKGCKLFRNNVGHFHLKDGRWIVAGLCTGSADLIGWFKGRFVAVEVKMPGKNATIEQKNFIEIVVADGGIAGIVYGVQDALALLPE
ncbi:MAG: VRR-NUC domain-containing protein [Rhabdochlamydiaceae bacterium]